MFGLMKLDKCCASSADKQRFRFFYCGVCKAVGKQFGHKMRLSVNYDIAFLAGILSELSGETEKACQWDHAFYHANCFILPREVPPSFSIAAAVNVLLAKLTVDDKIEDSSNRRIRPWRWLGNLMVQPFDRARRQLDELKFPVNRILELADRQQERESESRDSCRIYSEAALDYFSEPTAIITGIIFQQAARAVGKQPEMRNMFALGFNFGRMTYLLDALEDFEKDRKEANFNAVAAAYGSTDETLNENLGKRVRNVILESKEKILERLEKLPIPKETIAVFSRRLTVNLKKRLRTGNSKTFKPSLECVPGDAAAVNTPFTGKLEVAYAGGVNRIRRIGNKFRRYLHVSFFTLSIPLMYGARFLSFAVPPTEVPQTPAQKKDGCPGDCCCCDCCSECRSDCSDCPCECCGEGAGEGASGCCEACNCCDGCDCDCCGCDC
jgi:hypothetical protein